MSEEKNNVNEGICNTDKSKSSTAEETDNTTNVESSTGEKTDGTIKVERSISNWYRKANEANNSINQYYKETRIQARGLLFLSIVMCVVGAALFVLCINSCIQENKVHVLIVVLGMI